MKFEVKFDDGDGSADLEMVISGAPTHGGAPAAVAIIAPDEQTVRAVREYRAHLGGSRSNRHLFGTRAEAVARLKEQ